MSTPSTPADATPPPRSGDLTHLWLPDGELQIFPADAHEGDLSLTYVLDVLGIKVSLYVVLHGTTVVHVDTIDALSVPATHFTVYQVNNGPERDIEPRPHTPHPAADEAGPRPSSAQSHTEPGTEPQPDSSATESELPDEGILFEYLGIGDRIIYMADRTDMPAVVECIDTTGRAVHVRNALGELVELFEVDLEQCQRDVEIEN